MSQRVCNLPYNRFSRSDEHLAGHSILSHVPGNLYTLAINRVTAADGGLYVCELSNVLGSDSAVLQLVVVREAPRMYLINCLFVGMDREDL